MKRMTACQALRQAGSHETVRSARDVAFQRHTDDEGTGMAFILGCALELVLLVVADEVDHFLGPDILGRLLELLDDRQESPMAGIHVTLAEAVGLLVADQVGLDDVATPTTKDQSDAGIEDFLGRALLANVVQCVLDGQQQLGVTRLHTCSAAQDSQAHGQRCYDLVHSSIPLVIEGLPGMIRTSPSTEQPEAVQQSPVISILLTDVNCQHHYLATALDAPDRERCRRNPRLHERADWRTSRFLKQQAAVELASCAQWSMSHSAGHAALALGWGVDALGVDLEHTRARPFEDLLPAFVRSEEEAWWRESPDPGQAFYRL